MKVCSKCKQKKSEEAFNVRASGRGGLNSVCRECTKKARRQRRVFFPEKVRREVKNYRENRKKIPGFAKKASDNARNYRYGVSPKRYAEMLHKQKGVCAVCSLPYPSLCVDHCHRTDEIRGLLCQRCNTGIGFLMDSPESLRAAANYLEKTQTETQSPMIKKINRFLRFFGLNLVHAKKVKKAGYRVHVPIEDGKTLKPFNLAPVTNAELRDAGKTHYVGDSCPGGHVDASPTQDNKISGPTS